MSPSGERSGNIPDEAENFSAQAQVEKAPEYDTEAWGKLVVNEEGFGWLIQQGERLGVPTAEIDQVVRVLVTKMEEAGNFGKIFRFMKGAKTGQRLYGSDEAKAFGLRALEAAKAEQDFSEAAGLTSALFGFDSPEWEAAVKLAQARGRELEKKEKAVRKNKISLFPDASFADLFKALDDSDEEMRDLFEAELVDNFSPETVEEIEGLMDDEIKVGGVNIVEFFKKHGYTKKDITVFLPIGFKRR